MMPLSPWLPLKPKVDGFSYNDTLLLLPNRYFPFALGQLDLVRRARSFRARWWVIPAHGEVIQATDTFQYQFDVPNGSRLYGVMFSAKPPSTVQDWSVSVVDACTGVPLSNDFAFAQTLHSNFQSRMLPVLLSQPRLILDPGIVAVEIANRTTTDAVCQLLLMFAEPCKIIEEIPVSA